MQRNEVAYRAEFLCREPGRFRSCPIVSERRREKPGQEAPPRMLENGEGIVEAGLRYRRSPLPRLRYVRGATRATSSTP